MKVFIFFRFNFRKTEAVIVDMMPPILSFFDSDGGIGEKVTPLRIKVSQKLCCWCLLDSSDRTVQLSIGHDHTWILTFFSVYRTICYDCKYARNCVINRCDHCWEENHALLPIVLRRLPFRTRSTFRCSPEVISAATGLGSNTGLSAIGIGTLDLSTANSPNSLPALENGPCYKIKLISY